MTAAPRIGMPAERQRLAFQRGDAARDQHRIRPAAHMLYEHLVRFAGERGWCWPGEERLATQMQCSISTIKRMLRELIEAGLIARARRLNRSSLTYISAYNNSDAHRPDVDIIKNEHTNAPETVASAMAVVCIAPQDIPVLDPSPSTGEPFFGTTPDPSVGPSMNRVNLLKNQNPEGLVDGGAALPDHISLPMQPTLDSPVIGALRNAGVVDPGVLEELADQPLAQVEQAIRSVAKVRSFDDPRRPGLLVHILRNTEHPFSRVGNVAPHYEESLQAATTSLGECQSDVENAGVDSGNGTVAIWEPVLSCMAKEVPPEEFRTWLKPTRLLELRDNIAIVATPNVFVRDEVMNRYAQQVSHALTTQVGHTIEVIVVIN